MRLIGEAHRDPTPFESPQFLDQTIIQLLPPLAGEEVDDGRSALYKLGAIAPPAIHSVGQSYLFRVATVPAIFRQAHFFDGCLPSEGRKWRPLNDVG